MGHEHPGAAGRRPGLLRAGFRLILESEPDLEVAGESADGAEAVDAGRPAGAGRGAHGHPHARMDGVEATRRGSWRPTSQGADPDHLRPRRVRLRRAQGRGERLLLKDTPAEELVTAIRVVAVGDALLSPAVTRRLIGEFARQPVGPTAQPAALASLTARELEVLKLMARGMTNGEIARDLVVSETTVKTHVGRVLDKLSLRDRVQAVVFAYETALVRPAAG